MPKFDWPPADRPEELGVAVRCDRVDRAVGRDHLHGAHMVGSEAEAAGEVAHSPAERVPDDPDAGRRPGQRREAEGRGSVDDLAPGHAGLDPRAAPSGVDLHALQAFRRDEDRAVVRRHGPSVAGRLDLDRQPLGGRVAHRGRDVATATGGHYDRGPVGHRSVERCELTGGGRVVSVEHHPARHLGEPLES